MRLETPFGLRPHPQKEEKMEEQKIGEVIKFFGKIGVAAIRLTEGSLKVGDTIRIVGHTSDFSQVIESMQVDNASVQEAGKGADIGIKVKERVRDHDVVYKVTVTASRWKRSEAKKFRRGKGIEHSVLVSTKE
jgi:putative protease